MSKEEAYEVLKLKPNANYYEILGVTKNTPTAEIKKAYKKMSLKHHPDRVQLRNGTDDEVRIAKDAMQLIGEAIETLGDEEKRRLYNPDLQDKDNTKAPEASSVDLEEVLKRSQEIPREEVQESLAQQHFVQRVTISDLDAAIEAKNASIVVSEISARIMECVNKTDGKTAKNQEQIEDMLAYAPEYRAQIEEVMIKGVSNFINDTIKQGSGYIIDDSKNWQKVEDRLNSMPEKYRVEMVSSSLEGIDNTSRRDRLLDMLPKNQRELAMADVKPTAWQAIREAAALMRGDAGFEYDSAPVIAKAASKGKGR